MVSMRDCKNSDPHLYRPQQRAPHQSLRTTLVCATTTEVVGQDDDVTLSAASEYRMNENDDQSVVASLSSEPGIFRIEILLLRQHQYQ